MLETTSATASATPIKVGKLGHLVYEVSDIQRSVRFWTEIMGFQISDRNERGMIFLRHGSDHHSIGLVEVPGRVRPKPGENLQFSHLAMEVASVDILIAAREFLKQHGVPITFEGRKGPGGNTGLEFEDPDGYGFEIYVDMDQIPPSGAARPAEQWNRVRTIEDALANPLPAYPGSSK
jgi:catechol 2,3-dioxygenase-like lactoylglutathione lyase family enzyme